MDNNEPAKDPVGNRLGGEEEKNQDNRQQDVQEEQQHSGSRCHRQQD